VLRSLIAIYRALPVQPLKKILSRAFEWHRKRRLSQPERTIVIVRRDGLTYELDRRASPR